MCGFAFSWKSTNDLYKKRPQETHKSPTNRNSSKSTKIKNLAVAQAGGLQIENQKLQIGFFEKREKRQN